MAENMTPVDRVFCDFPEKGYTLEIVVLDGSGEFFLVFAGPSEELQEQHFTKCFRNAGCFYSITCLGVESHLMESLDLHQDCIRRIEFCWLTPPRAPYLLTQYGSSVTVAWEECLYCGFSGELADPKAVLYIVEIAEGHEAKRGGIAARYATDTNVEENYSRVCARYEKGQIEITDLKRATWYHVRNVVVVHGERHVSKRTTFKTTSDIPEAPECPRVYEIPNRSAEDPSKERAPAVVLQWTEPGCNGAAIESYQVQFQETVIRLEEGFDAHEYKIGSPLYVNKATSRTPNLGEEKEQLAKAQAARRVASRGGSRSASRGGGSGGAGEAEEKGSSSKKTVTIDEKATSRPSTALSSVSEYGDGWNIVTGKWTAVYNHGEKKLKLSAPSDKTLEWKFRIRARNQHGWSPFSPVLYMHRKSHPSLFDIWFPPHMQVDMRASKPTPNPLLSPDKVHDASGLAIARKEYVHSPIQSTRPSGMPLLASSGYNNMMTAQLLVPGGAGGQGQGVPGMMYGMDTTLMMGGLPRGAPAAHLQMQQMHPGDGVHDDILESMPLSAGDSGVLMSRQRPSSADSAESASMLDRRSSKESNRNRNSDFSPGSTPTAADGTRRRSAPPKPSASSSLFIE